MTLAESHAGHHPLQLLLLELDGGAMAVVDDAGLSLLRHALAAVGGDAVVKAEAVSLAGHGEGLLGAEGGPG